MDSADVDRWFGEYLTAFAACGRGESDASSLLAYYGVPLLLTTDDGFVALTTGDEVVAMAQRQIDGMRAADYHHSEVLDSQISALNAVSVLYRGTFSRRRRDGSEIGRLTATYLHRCAGRSAHLGLGAARFLTSAGGAGVPRRRRNCRNALVSSQCRVGNQGMIAFITSFPRRALLLPRLAVLWLELRRADKAGRRHEAVLDELMNTAVGPVPCAKRRRPVRLLVR